MRSYRFIKDRRLWIVTFLILLSFVLFIEAVWPPPIIPPSEPFEAGAGPCPPCQINHTEVTICIPTNLITMTVFFKSCESTEYYIWALLPFTARDVEAFIHTSPTGNITIKRSFENLLEHGVCIANATFRSENYERFSEVHISLSFQLLSDIEAVHWPWWNYLPSPRGVILTFFGPRGALGYPEKLLEYQGCGLNISRLDTAPIYVHVNLPKGTYLSTQTYPEPIQYYIQGENTCAMFQLTFPLGKYAQTISCYFIDMTIEQMKQINIFIAGTSIGIGGSIIANYIEEKIKDKHQIT